MSEPTKTTTRQHSGCQVITAQTYLDDAIVDAKIDASDYDVDIIEIKHEDVWFAVVVNGNHSLEAAKRAGVVPVFVVNSFAQEEADRNGSQWALERHYVDGEYVDAFDRSFVW